MLNHRWLSKRITPVTVLNGSLVPPAYWQIAQQMPKAARHEIGSTAFLPGRSIA
jgi:hypothetical protein